MRVLLNLTILLLSILQAQSIDYGCKTESMPVDQLLEIKQNIDCLLYTSPSPRDATLSRMPSSA